jgi:hypothetical protein
MHFLSWNDFYGFKVAYYDELYGEWSDYSEPAYVVALMRNII